jgi:iron transport multicopper oxidase
MFSVSPPFGVSDHLNSLSHIDFHLDIGLAIVFAEDTDTVANSVHPSTCCYVVLLVMADSEFLTLGEWDSLCPTYDALTPAQLGGTR